MARQHLQSKGLSPRQGVALAALPKPWTSSFCTLWRCLKLLCSQAETQLSCLLCLAQSSTIPVVSLPKPIQEIHLRRWMCLFEVAGTHVLHGLYPQRQVCVLNVKTRGRKSSFHFEISGCIEFCCIEFMLCRIFRFLIFCSIFSDDSKSPCQLSPWGVQPPYFQSYYSV